MIKTHIYPVLIIFLSFVFNMQGQEALAKQYQIILQIIAVDTVPDEYAIRLLALKLENGTINKQDSLDFWQKVRNRPLLLLRNSKNTYAKEILAKQYMDTAEIAKYLGRNQLLKIVENIGPDLNHPEELDKTGIEMISEKPKIKPHHYFSAPQKVEQGRYIIYHFRSVSRRVGKSEFIVYRVDESQTIKIEKSFVLWEH